MLKQCFLLSLMLNSCLGIIYSINESEYDRMPALYALDDYDACMLDAKAVFCLAHADLFTDSQSELFNFIKNYSEYNIKHFDHTRIHRGVCLTRTCRKYVLTNESTTADPGRLLEACINESLWNDYQLQVRNVKILYCETPDSTIPVDAADICMAVVYVTLISLNAIGSLYDVYKDKNNEGNKFLLTFSVFRNWKKLTAPSGSGPDPRLERLKVFNGIRTMTMICVFFSHTTLVMVFSYVDNPYYVEKAYDELSKHVLFNGSLVTLSFFAMSSFLLAYNMEIYAEKHPISWMQLPKGMMQRWLRLTPTYALVLGTVCTWMRHLGRGPLWQQVVTSESDACRRYWWAHLLYINNYVYRDAFCFPQSWYLAADTQLFCLALALCVACQSCGARRAMLAAMAVLSLAIPAVQTYVQDLDATVIHRPESYRDLYATNATFRTLYISGHGNLATYTIGLAAGLLAYRWHNKQIDLTNYKRWWQRCLYWALFPAGVAVILSGSMFYKDGARAHIAYRMLYAVAYKPLFQLLVMVVILATMFKYEKVYSGVLEWRGWAWSGRVSYSGFLLHSLFQRGMLGVQRRPSYMSDYYIVTMLAGTVCIVFALSALFWVTVESPLCQLIKMATSPPDKMDTDQMEKNITPATVATVELSQSKL